MGSSAFGNILTEGAFAVVGRLTWRLGMALCFACCLGLMAVHPVWAAEFTVDTVLDGVDTNIGDDQCVNDTVAPGNKCTLRAAIQEANSTVGADTINLPAGTYILSIENQLENAENESATGDLDVTTNIVINGEDAKTTIVAAKADLNDRVFHLVGDEAVLALNRLTVTGGDTTLLVAGTRDGGGILNGGGLFEGFELVVSNSKSPTFGGGIYTIGTKSTVLHSCTINGNAAVGNNEQAGGIWVGQNHSVTLANCTISDNEAESRGGGIVVANNSDLAYILNTTVANNRLLDDPEEGAGIYIGNNTEVQVMSSIFANNFAQGNVANDCDGQFDLLDFSLVEAPSSGCIVAGDGENNSSLLGSADPKLGPLADNGGSLQTHALLEGSLAIDAGSQLLPGSGGRACESTDARGQARPGRVYCDMGAYELPSVLFMPKLKK